MRKALASATLVCGAALCGNVVAQTIVTTLPGSTGPSSLSIDSSNVYYGALSGGTFNLYTAPRSGGASTLLYTSPAGAANPYLNGSAVIGSNLYFQNPNSGPVTDTQIFSAPKDGSGPITAIYTGNNVGQPIFDGVDLTTNGTLLFSGDAAGGRIFTLTTSGGSITQIGSDIFGAEQGVQVATGGGNAFIATGGGGDGVVGIWSVPETGGSMQNVLSGGAAASLNDLAYLGGNLYWTTGTNTLYSIAATGGAVSSFASPLFSSLTGVASFDGALYLEDAAAAGTIVWEYSVAAVPEPEIYAELACGIGLLGFFARHRRAADLFRSYL